MRAIAALPVSATASLGAHLGMALFLALAIAPKPFAPQKPVETRLSVEAYEVERSTAAEAQPQAEAAPEAQAEGAEVASGTVPQSRAEAAPVTPERAAAAAPQGESVAAAAPPAESASAAAPEAERPEAAQPEAVRAEAAAPPAEAIAPAARPAETVSAAAPVAAVAASSEVAATPVAAAPPAAETVAAALPDAPPASARAADIAAAPAAAPEAEAAPAAPPPAEAAPAAPPEAEDVAAAAPPATALAEGEAETAQAASLAPPAEKGTATTAFAGADGALDPKSLEAIQAFMQPGDVSAAAGEVRDGIEGLLASVPCSRLQVEFDPGTGALTLRGHIPEEGLRGPVLAALTEQIGTGIPVTQDVRILPRPICGALSGVGDVGLPQSTELLGNPRIIGSDGYVAEESYVAGDFVHFTMEGLDYPAFVYVDYFFADGTVAHLVPNETVALSVLPPGERFRVGNEEPGPGEVRLQVGPPYGQEIAVAFASSVPLYDGLRPLVEPAAEYLEFLKGRVAEAREATPDFKGEWVYFFISTAER